MQKNKIIAVWGNPNSGKTILATKLARKLSKQKKNVILVLCDNIKPTLSTILPLEDAKDKSLGGLLSSMQITQESILHKCITLSKNDYLSIISYLHGENERTYAKYSKERVIDLFILLKHLADYIIVDCSSVVSNDILSRTALERSDQVIRLISPDLKAISFYDSCLPQLAERKYNIQNHMKIISNAKYNMPKDSVANKFGGISLELPFTEEIEQQYFEGRLFDRLESKKSRDYLKSLNDIVKMIEGEIETSEDNVPNKIKEKRKFKNPLKGFKKKGGNKS